MGWQRGWAKRRACDAPQEVGRPDVTLYTPSTGGSSRGNRITALEQRREVAQLRQPEIGRDPVVVSGCGPVQQMVALPSGRGSPFRGAALGGPQEDVDQVLPPPIPQSRDRPAAHVFEPSPDEREAATGEVVHGRRASEFAIEIGRASCREREEVLEGAGI